MTDRDTFAAAALTGLLARVPVSEDDDSKFPPEVVAPCAYRWADAMLAERANHSEKPNSCGPGVAEAYATAQQISDARDYVRTMHEFYAWRHAEPAAASRSETKQDAGKRPSATCAGNTLDVEEVLRELSDVLSTCRDAASAIERLRAWVNELQLSRSEIDALEYVVEKGRIASNIDYGILRSLLVRLRPEWGRLHSDDAEYTGGISGGGEAKCDRPEPITESGNAETAKTNTSQPFAVGRELCDRLKRMNDALEQEPVAWGLLDEDEVHSAYVFKDEAEITLKRTGDTDSVIIPLYAHPPQDRVVRLPRYPRAVVLSESLSDWKSGFNRAVSAIQKALDAAGVKWEVGDE